MAGLREFLWEILRFDGWALDGLGVFPEDKEAAEELDFRAGKIPQGINGWVETHPYQPGAFWGVVGD